MEKKDSDSHVEYLKKKSREYSIKDGIFATIKDSFGNSYISPFAIAMNSSNYLIAMLSSIPGLLGPISQLKSARLIEKHKRKKIVLTAVSIEILTLIPLVLIALLYYFDIIKNILPLMFLIFFSIYIIASNVGASAWFSWIGDLVSEKDRGRWFGKRNFIFGITAFFATISAAIFLDFLKKKNLQILGFAVLFFLAMLARIVSRYYLSKKYEPEFSISKKSYFSFYQFIKKAPFNNFGRFAIFRALMNFSTMIAGPFFAVYMLKELEFNYVTYMIIILSQTVAAFIIIKFWGRFSDHYGNYEVLKITSILVAIYPLTWLISNNPIYLILGPQLIVGVGWAGFNLAAANYVFDCVTTEKRSLAVSYYEMVNGIGIFLGGVIGAILITYAKISFMNIILFIFLISGLARIATVIIMIPHIKEVKNKPKFHSSKILIHFIYKMIRIPGGHEGEYDLKIHPSKK